MIKSFYPKPAVTRRLIDGREVEERLALAEISLRTKCPAKWAFVDLEEGIVWEHDGNAFRRLPFANDRARHDFVRKVASLTNDTVNG